MEKSFGGSIRLIGPINFQAFKLTSVVFAGTFPYIPLVTRMLIEHIGYSIERFVHNIFIN